MPQLRTTRLALEILRQNPEIEFSIKELAVQILEAHSSDSPLGEADKFDSEKKDLSQVVNELYAASYKR